jgi:hypothetical protein
MITRCSAPNYHSRDSDVVMVMVSAKDEHYPIVQYSTVQYSTVQYSTVQYSTVQYSTVQYSTVYSIIVVSATHEHDDTLLVRGMTNGEAQTSDMCLTTTTTRFFP